jgi:KaiC/GvpD/RAD55 family RecA-like ATPase
MKNEKDHSSKGNKDLENINIERGKLSNDEAEINPSIEDTEDILSLMEEENVEPLLETEPEIQPDLELEIEEEEIEDSTEEPVDLTKDFYNLNELMRLKVTEIPFLVNSLFPERTISILSGDSDTGKSVFYLQLALAIIEGKTDFLGLQLKTKYRSVLVISSEDGAITISVRIKKQLQGRKLSKEDSLRMNIITNGYEAIKRIRQSLQESPVDLVVIDAFSDVFDEDLNSSNDTRNYLAEFNDIIQEYGCSVLFVHHIGKGKENLPANKGHMLGSVGIHGKARSVIMLSKLPSNPNVKTLIIVKGNYVSEDVKKRKMLLEFNPETLCHTVVTDDSLKKEIEDQLNNPESVARKGNGKLDLLKEQAWQLSQEGKSQAEIMKVVGRSKATVSKWLNNHKPFFNAGDVV